MAAPFLVSPFLSIRSIAICASMSSLSFPRPSDFLPLEIGVIGQACRNGLISVEAVDIRDFTHDRHGTADDYQFGGGHGMIMKPGPVFEAAESALSGLHLRATRLYASGPLDPSG